MSHPLADPSPGSEAAFVELGKILHGEAPLNDVLLRVAEAARQIIPEVTDVSITTIENDQPRTVVFTGPVAIYLDERQYEKGFGPCMDAAVSGNTVLVDSADPRSDYADFAAVAREQSITYTLSTGMPVPQRVVGGLNLYSRSELAPSEQSIATAETFAAYAGVAVANAVLFHNTVNLTQHLRAAMHSRAVIEQAKGVLMARQRCSADDAFAILTRLSQNRNVKLRTVAEQIVGSVQGARSTN